MLVDVFVKFLKRAVAPECVTGKGREIGIRVKKRNAMMEGKRGSRSLLATLEPCIMGRQQGHRMSNMKTDDAQRAHTL